MHNQIFLKVHSLSVLSRHSPLILTKKNIPVSSSQQQITDHHAEPQEHSPHRHNKSDLWRII